MVLLEKGRDSIRRGLRVFEQSRRSTVSNLITLSVGLFEITTIVITLVQAIQGQPVYNVCGFEHNMPELNPQNIARFLKGFRPKEEQGNVSGTGRVVWELGVALYHA